jgi:endogenous inhibitor of DNA gyrase (YacG/DUF329 family)
MINAGKKARCPICDREMPGQASEWPDYPFCSARCRKIDLGRWLGEKYRIPGPEAKESGDPPPDDSEAADDP